jgi:hypothetical protein
MPSPKFGYLPPVELAPNLWEMRGQWSGSFGRRMTVIRLADGRIAIHNAFELEPKEITWLKSLGEPSFVIAPNVFHCSDAGWMARQFPAAELFVPEAKLASYRAEGFSPKDMNREFPSLPELTCVPMEGTRIQEAAFLHHPSRTLVLCDLSFHMASEFSGLERIFMRWNKVGGGRFGPSRLTRLLFTKDKRALVDSYARLLELDFDRVIVNHGDVLPTGGRELLSAGVREIFGA